GPGGGPFLHSWAAEVAAGFWALVAMVLPGSKQAVSQSRLDSLEVDMALIEEIRPNCELGSFRPPRSGPAL
ncbi:MAG: hypothetical protein J0H21_09160, partial [Rhizobiales bacterium]|nr:hypothetical protein [Hyphomicrobiales bacterium]